MRGDNFMSVHPYFDEIIDTLREMMDWVAEAIGRTGDYPVHTLSECLRLSEIKEEEILKDISSMVSDESLELKILVAIVYGGIQAGVFNPSMESTLTNFTDKLESHAWWCDQTVSQWTKVGPIRLSESK
jgi:DNA-binding ferritin-like protein